MAFLALPFALPPKAWKIVGGALAALAVVAAVFFAIRAYGNARHDLGQTEERAVWEKMVAEQNRKVAEAQRAADAVLAAARNGDQQELERQQKELEDAVADIPDQGTSARQRARACLELRRQGQAPAACQPDTAR